MGRIKSATLVETIIAAVIIVTLFICINVVFINVQRNTPVWTRLRALKIIDEQAALVISGAHFSDRVIQQGELQLQENLVEIIHDKAFKIRFTVLDKHGIALEQQERILLVQ